MIIGGDEKCLEDSDKEENLCENDGGRVEGEDNGSEGSYICASEGQVGSSHGEAKPCQTWKFCSNIVVVVYCITLFSCRALRPVRCNLVGERKCCPFMLFCSKGRLLIVSLSIFLIVLRYPASGYRPSCPLSVPYCRQCSHVARYSPSNKTEQERPEWLMEPGNRRG